MSTIFTPAPEVKAIAVPLIAAHHTHLLHNAVRIEYLFCDTPKKSKGKAALAYVQQISNLPAYLAGEVVADEDGDQDIQHTGEPFFVMVVWQNFWRYSLSPKQREALIDHELCHLWAEADEKTGEVKLSMLPHDLEEFNAVVRRHGIWLKDVDQLIKAAQDGPQMTLAEISAGNAGSAMIEDAAGTKVTLSSGPTSVTLTKEHFGKLAQTIRDSKVLRGGEGE